MISFICRIKTIKQMNLYSKTATDSDIKNDLVVRSGKREGAGQGRNMELRYKILCLKEKSKK